MVAPLTKGQWIRSFDVLSLLSWISCWTNIRVTSDLGRHDAHGSSLQWEYFTSVQALVSESHTSSCLNALQKHEATWWGVFLFQFGMRFRGTAVGTRPANSSAWTFDTISRVWEFARSQDESSNSYCAMSTADFWAHCNIRWDVRSWDLTNAQASVLKCSYPLGIWQAPIPFKFQRDWSPW